MICSKCGSNVPDDSKFCVRCGSKIEKVEVVKKEEAPQNAVCCKCGATLNPGAKFCSKCGSTQTDKKVESATAVQEQKVSKPAVAPQQPVASTPIETSNEPKKKKSKKGLIIVILLLLILGIAVGAVYYFVVIQGINPLESLSSKTDVSEEKEDEDEDDGKEDKKSDEESSAEKESDDSKEAEAEKGDVTLLDPAKLLVADAKTEYEAKNYVDGAIPNSKDAINQFVTVGEANNLHDEAQEGIDSVYWIYVESIIRYCDSLKTQGASAACFEQINGILTEAMDFTTTLSDKGYEVEDSELYTYKDGTIVAFKEMFIESINGITEYENWSRDEAWNYAEQAYSIKEDGKTLLIDQENLDDPMRLRYGYCLAWITRKRCETGLADGSLTNEDVVRNMESILAETDYNLLLIQDIITYGSAAGMDVTKYQKAYNATVEEIKNSQGLAIGNDIGINSGSSVDLRHFWYFNDLDGEDKYKVDTQNGTTAKTREWIRSNVPVILSE